MKPAQERNQECLPPKKRDLPVSNCGSAAGTPGAGTAVERERGGGAAASGGGSIVGEDEAGSIQNCVANSDSQGGPPSGEWLRAQPGLHYGVDTSEGISAVPVDQYSMLYKVALPSVTYSPTSPHPVLSHISPAYTVHSPLLQHPGLPYPPLGYAQVPHSSLQFVSSPYAAVPYALPPGFVPGSLISPSGTIPQAHAVPHLVPYPSVIQEGVVSPPPQAQVAAHTFAKVSASSGVPLMLPSEQVAQQHLSTVGVMSATELSSRGMPLFYHPQGAARAPASRDTHSMHQEKEPEINGGDKGQGARELALDSSYPGRNARVQQVTAIPAAHEPNQKRRLSSPGHRSTPDSDLEVQQVVGSLASSSSQSISGGRKEVSFAPLNLSQSVQKARDIHGENPALASGRAAFVAQPVNYGEPRVSGLQQQQQVVQPAHAVMLSNGQPVLIPVEYHPQPQQHYPAQANDGSPKPSFKASDPSARACLPERAGGEPVVPLQQQPQPPAEVTQALASCTVPGPAPGNPSHFMKGAIIQLATGELKRVEDLQTQDFVRSAELSGGLKIDSSMVVDIRASQQRPGLVTLHFTVGEQQSKVTIDVPPEHPFFVFGQGWSSYSPEHTAQLYGLPCHQIQVGDVCVSITLQQQPSQQKAAQHHHPQQQNVAKTVSKSTEHAHQLMGPPAPQQPRPQAHFRTERVHRDRPREAEEDATDREEATHHPEPHMRPSWTSGEHPRSQSGYHLHTDASAFAGAAMGAVLGASQRRWSSPGLQRYSMKGEHGACPQISTSGHIRPSFIPQEVKLSIEGRSNAGK
ncbi:ataxin-1-like [Phyllopteryx taeniolatus]|uniref:ataxin-1-like n=1 Tax=Phyllopteryx taeniolatus TaxID=161469 RepID=UPI002AD1EB76|nr:ataxin-1-like [Phyllopteryx taeniolatus]XP_061610614.1 ataxin-1-like [Phyllopteryx taeniolatus]